MLNFIIFLPLLFLQLSNQLNQKNLSLLSIQPAVIIISCNLSNPTSEKIGFVHHALMERYLATTLISTSNSTSVKNG